LTAGTGFEGPRQPYAVEAFASTGVGFI